MLGEILLSLPIIVMLSFLIYVIHKKTKSNIFDNDEFAFALVCVAMILIICLLPAFMFYGEAVYLPYDYKASCKTVEETKELLTLFENSSGVGQGLEALQLKQSISETIGNMNTKYAKIQAWLNNPWMPFSGVIRSGLPSDF